MYNGGPGVEEVLVDTTGLWGLTYEDSKFHNFMKKLVKQRIIVVPATQILELLIVVYREKSGHGKSLEEGLKQIQVISDFYSNIEKLKLLEISINFHPISGLDIINATELILKYPKYFVKGGPKGTKWLEFIDATTATIWQKTQLTLYTADPKLMRFGDEHGLPHEIIKAK